MRALFTVAVLLTTLFPAFSQKTKIPAKNYPSLLWEITGPGLSKPSYLFATMHVSSKMVFHLSDSFYLGIKSAEVVALETDMGSWQEDFSRYEMNESSYGASWRSGYGYGSPSDYLTMRSLQYPSYEKIIEMDPTFPWAHSHLSRIYRLNGDLASAAEERSISLEMDGQPDLARGARESFAKGGWDAMQEYMRHHNSTLFSVMLTTQEKDRWIADLTTQANNGSFWLFLIKTDPIFDPLRGDPRFDTLLHKFDVPNV